MNDIIVTEQGRIDINSIERLSFPDVRQWIENRLLGKDTQVPEDFRQGYDAYYVISQIYKKVNRHVREDICQIVFGFLKDMALNPQSLWKEESGHQLLMLIQYVSLEESFDLIFEMAKSHRFFSENAQLEKDLHYRVLQTLVSLGFRLGPYFWIEQFNRAPERYAGVVFDGVSLFSIEEAIKFLGQINSKIEIDRIISSFPFLLENYGANHIAALIEEYYNKMQPIVKIAVKTFL